MSFAGVCRRAQRAAAERLVVWRASVVVLVLVAGLGLFGFAVAYKVALALPLVSLAMVIAVTSFIYAALRPHMLMRLFLIMAPFVYVFTILPQKPLGIVTFALLKDIMLGLLLAGYLTHMLLLRARWGSIAPGALWPIAGIAAFTLITIVPALITRDSITAVQGIRRNSEWMWAFCLAIVFFRSKADVKFFVILLIAQGFLAALLTGVEYTLNPSKQVGVRYVVTAGSAVGHSVFTQAFFMLFPATFCMCLSMGRPVIWSWRARGLLIGVIVVIAVTFLGHHERTPFAMLALAFLIVGLRRRAPTPIVVGVTVCLLVFMFNPVLQDRLIGRFTKTGYTNTRLAQWSIALDAFAGHPLGVSPYGVFGAWEYSSRAEWQAYVDNHYIYLLAQYGLVGFSVFMAILWLVVRQAVFCVRRLADPFLRAVALGCAILLVLYCAAAAFWVIWLIYPAALYFWLIAGLVFVLPRIDREPRTVALKGQFGMVPS